MLRNLCKIALLMGCGASVASYADATYELKDIQSYGSGLYPSLNLSGATSTTIQTSLSTNGSNEIVIDELAISFPEANDLVITNFKSNGNEHVAVIDDAWVFSKLLVTVHMMPTAEELSHVFINLSVLESDSKINSAAIQAQSQPMLADIDGLLTNVTPKTLADTITFDHQGKALSLELYRDLVVDYGGTAFDLSISWLGHGTGTVKVPAPFSNNELGVVSGISLAVNNEGAEPMLEIEIINPQSYKELFVFPVSEIVMYSGL